MGVSRQFHEREQPLFVLDIGRYKGRRSEQSRYRSLSARRAAAIYISETITAARSQQAAKSYVAIADHINSYSTFKEYTTDETKYDTLAEAYAAYKERVEDDVRFQQYKNTLPE